MKRQNSEVRLEVVVGGFVLTMVAVVAVFSIFISSNNIFKKTYDYYIEFPNVSGMVNGNDVYYRGIPFGNVKSMEVLTDRKGVLVKVGMDHQIILHEDYKCEIIAASALGGKWLVIDEGSLEQPEISDYTILRGEQPVDIIEEATAMVREVRDAVNEGKLIENLSASAKEISEIAGKINKGEGSIAQLINDTNLYAQVQSTVENLEKTIENIRSASQNVADGKGTIGKLLSDDETLYNEMSEALASINNSAASIEKMVNNINSGEGTVGQLVGNDELYEELLGLITEARATIDDLRETSPITSFSSIFFGAF